MTTDPFALIDVERLRVFARLSEPGLFRDSHHFTDAGGVRWMWTPVCGSAVALTWLGPGRVWDAAWASEHPADLARDLEHMRSAGPAEHVAEFRVATSRLRLGGIAGRVIYSVHRAALAQKSSLLTVADTWLAEMAWGRSGTPPRHWRSVLAAVLGGLTWLHVSDRRPGGEPPAFGTASALFTHVGDCRGTDDDTCTGHCGARFGATHHHWQIDIAPGFLGQLERFGRDVGGTGVRTYEFSMSDRRAGMSLRTAGKSGRLVSAFVPAYLGEPAACRAIGSAGRHLLHTLVRETTRPTALKRSAPGPRADVVSDGRVRDYAGRSAFPCELLPSDGNAYVGFNGNGKRRGMGYRLDGEWGWLAKAAYPAEAGAVFLDRLAALAAPLGLIVVGVGPSNTLYPLSQLRGMAANVPGRSLLRRVDIRVFTPSDYVVRWSKTFGWELGGGVDVRPQLTVLAAMQARNVSCRRLANEVACDHSFLAKLLKGTKPWPSTLLARVLACIERYDVAGPRVGKPAPVCVVP